jgi:hypothetical protein
MRCDEAIGCPVLVACKRRENELEDIQVAYTTDVRARLANCTSDRALGEGVHEPVAKPTGKPRDAPTLARHSRDQWIDVLLIVPAVPKGQEP